MYMYVSMYLSIYMYFIKFSCYVFIISFHNLFYLSSTSLFSVFAMCAIFIVIIAQFSVETFDVIFQMNISRSRSMPIMTEYFIDQEKYFYFILLCTYITICVQVIITLAIGTTFITFFQHIYGMFKIARYTNKDINKSCKKIIIIQNLLF